MTVPGLRYAGTCPSCEAEHYASVEEQPPTHCLRCGDVELVSDSADEQLEGSDPETRRKWRGFLGWWGDDK